MVRFEWDETKARSNEQKHGVRFEDAMLVFADTYALSEQDRIENSETPLADHGLSWGYRRAPRVHTVRSERGEEIIRIISARKAVRKERNRYDENRTKNSFE